MSSPTEEAPAFPNKRLDWLQCTRAAAALLVVGYHASFRTMGVTDGSAHMLFPMFEYGHVGVDLFFVISGFIIAYIHGKDIGKPKQFRGYAYKRVTRIYPLYWVLFLGIMPLYFIIPSAGEEYQRNFGNLLGSFFLLPVPPKQVIGVAWSLVLEMIFYAVFAIAIMNRRVGIACLIVWPVLVLAVAIFQPDLPYAIQQVFRPQILGFYVGMGIAISVRSARPISIPPIVLVVLAIVFALSPQWFASFANVRSLSFVAPIYGLAGLFVFLALTMDFRGKPAPKLLVAIGNATYSIYLFHWLVGWGIEKIVSKLGLQQYIEPNIFFLAQCIAMVAFGLFIYRYVERPLMRLTQHIPQRLELWKFA